MHLNTYRSRAAPETYVTMPTVEAAAIFTLVEELACLDLTPVRCGYTLSPDAQGDSFRESITLQIGASGYAVHGFDPAIPSRAT